MFGALPITLTKAVGQAEGNAENHGI